MITEVKEIVDYLIDYELKYNKVRNLIDLFLVVLTKATLMT